MRLDVKEISSGICQKILDPFLGMCVDEPRLLQLLIITQHARHATPR